MKKKLRIVFMGTPDFAVASLKSLVENDHNIVGVITAPDRPAGRGRKIRTSAVKDYALEKGLRLLQPTNLKNETFLQELKSLEADLQIVVAFRMLPKVVWKLPPEGTFNLHASLLPEYRGAAPINWALINGEKRTGVTTFFINENIDTGAIILQKEVSIDKDESAGELHDKLMNLGSELVVQTVELIASGTAESKEQSNTSSKHAPKLTKENCRIQWDQPIERVHNHIRGLSPYPAAWTLLPSQQGETEFKIFESSVIDKEHDSDPGTIEVHDKEIWVAVQRGYLRINSLQMSGKRKMDAASFLNGYRFSGKDRFL